MVDNLNLDKNENKEINTSASDQNPDIKKSFPNTKDNQIDSKSTNNPELLQKANEINDSFTKSPDVNIKPKKEPPIEKKPFLEFINEFLLPAITNEFGERGLEVEKIHLENTFRPIAGDKCWVIYCEIRDTCNFWLSFEKDDISSLKSISLSKPDQKPSVIESFLIDEKRITLQLITSRILQRLNGQKLLGVN